MHSIVFTKGRMELFFLPQLRISCECATTDRPDAQMFCEITYWFVLWFPPLRADSLIGTPTWCLHLLLSWPLYSSCNMKYCSCIVSLLTMNYVFSGQRYHM